MGTPACKANSVALCAIKPVCSAGLSAALRHWRAGWRLRRLFLLEGTRLAGAGVYERGRCDTELVHESSGTSSGGVLQPALRKSVDAMEECRSVIT